MRPRERDEVLLDLEKGRARLFPRVDALAQSLGGGLEEALLAVEERRELEASIAQVLRVGAPDRDDVLLRGGDPGASHDVAHDRGEALALEALAEAGQETSCDELQEH